VQLSELVDHLCPARVNGQLSPLSVHADGRVSRSGQQHAGLLIQAEEGGARLKSLRRRRVGVVGHDLQETRGTGNPSHSPRRADRERKKKDGQQTSLALQLFTSSARSCGSHIPTRADDVAAPVSHNHFMYIFSNFTQIK